MKIFSTIIIAFAFSLGSLFAQDFSISANLGWAIPGGSGVGDEIEDLNLNGGLTISGDLLYYVTPNIGVGLNYASSALAGASTEEGVIGDIDLYGMRFIGAKGMYRLKDEGFTPYGALSLGLAQLTTPGYTISSGGSEPVVVEEQKGGGFGIIPEVGIQIGGFQISAFYLLPTKYSIENVITDKSVGTLNINLGYRYNFGF